MFQRVINQDIQRNKLVELIFTTPPCSLLQDMIPKFDNIYISFSKINDFEIDDENFKIYCDVNLSKKTGRNRKQYNISTVVHFNLDMNLLTAIRIFSHD